MSNEQTPEALRLAHWFNESNGFSQGTKAPHKWVLQANAELRRLHAENEAMKAQSFTAADMATAAAQGFRDGVASVSAVSEPVASYAIRLLVAAALITQAKADEALRLAADITAAPGPADGESNE